MQKLLGHLSHACADFEFLGAEDLNDDVVRLHTLAHHKTCAVLEAKKAVARVDETPSGEASAIVAWLQSSPENM